MAGFDPWAQPTGTERSQLAQATQLELATFQWCGALVLARIVRRFGGALLLDDVGSGKTRTAIATALALHGSDAEVAIVTPTTLRSQWEAECARAAIRPRFFTHAQLSRSAEVDFGSADLVIIDEAHHFREHGTRRRACLDQSLGFRQALLLTATPLHNRVADAVSLLEMFRPKAWLLGCGNTASAETSPNVTREQLRKILQYVSVRRTSSRIRAFEESAATTSFSARNEVRARAMPQLKATNTITQVHSIIDVDVNQWLTVIASIVGAVLPLGEPPALLELSLLRRLSSSPEAALDSLVRLRRFLDALRDASLHGHTLSRSEFNRHFHKTADDPVQTLLPFWYQDASPGFSDLSDRVAQVDQIFDGLPCTSLAKRPAFSELLDTLGASHRPALVFCNYIRTVNTIYRDLPAGFRVLTLSGDGARIRGFGRVSRETALRYFGDWTGSALRTVLILTDLGSEGLNLQTSDHVIHFDLPWTPARVRQREGRVDRIGGEQQIRVDTFLPDARLERRIRLLERLQRKAALDEPLSHGNEQLFPEMRMVLGESAELPEVWPLFRAANRKTPVIEQALERSFDRLCSLELAGDRKAAERLRPLVDLLNADHALPRLLYLEKAAAHGERALWEIVRRINPSLSRQE